MKTLIGLLTACALSLAFAAPASAATFTVDDLSDVHDIDFGMTHDGVCDATGADTCTLRAALEEANATVVGTDTVNVTLPGTIALAPANAELIITDVTTVNGNAGGTTIDAGGTNRVLSTFGTSVTLNDLRLQNGAVTDNSGAGIFSVAPLLILNRVTVSGNTLNSASGGAAGGGIAALPSSALVLNDSTVSGNTIIGTSGLGAGIRAFGPLTLTRSTVSGNTTTLDAGGRGGGIEHNATNPTTLTITNSTISGNQSGAGGGGGVFGTADVTTSIIGSTIAGNSTSGTGGALRLFGPNPVSENTIYAANTAGSADPNCSAGFTSAENNIDTGTSCGFGTTNGNQENVSTGALGLGALASNGGPTQTRSIPSGSVAQNAASADCGGLAVDQRNVVRPQGASCDIGAFELEVAPPTPPGGGTVTPITTPVVPTPPAAPRKCKKGQKLKKGKCTRPGTGVKKKAKKK